ncbi:DUF6894 family protein [Methylorubrum extorquens]
MPRYFFNVRHRPGPAGLAEDREGDELVDVAAAREHALSEAKAVIARDQLATIRDWMDCSFEIMDGDGQLVLTVPFSDTVQEQDED